MRKNIILCLVAVLFFTSQRVRAQDTVSYPMDCYFYKPMTTAYRMPYDYMCYYQTIHPALYFHTDDTITIYGIAITFFLVDMQVHNGYSFIFDMTSDMYDSIPDLKPTLLVSTPCIDTTLSMGEGWEDVARVDSICKHGCVAQVEQIKIKNKNTLRKELTFQYEYEYPTPGEWDVYCAEFYFDIPHRVKDTFYIAIATDTIYNRYWPGYAAVSVADTVKRDYLTYYSSADFEGMGYENQIECLTTHWFTQGPFASNGTTSGWGAYFPIVKLRCTPVKGLSLMGQGKGWARIGWRRFVDEGISYDLELVKYKTGSGGDTVVLDDTLLLSLTDTAHLFADLDLGGHYAYRVRKHCRYATVAYDTTVASEWTPRKYFDIDTYDWESVDNAPAADFGLSPNPAHGAATLALRQPADADARVEVTDALGRTVLAQPLPAGADRVTLDLGRLSAGTYLVKVLTPRATAAHRLIVW